MEFRRRGENEDREVCVCVSVWVWEKQRAKSAVVERICSFLVHKKENAVVLRVQKNKTKTKKGTEVVLDA